MIAARLVRLIETHADDLADRLAQRLHAAPRTAAYRQLDDLEVRSRAQRVYRNLGHWLEQASEQLVEDEYLRLGRDRRVEGVPLAQVVAALLLTRRSLWDFIPGFRRHPSGCPDEPPRREIRAEATWHIPLEP